MVPIGVLRDNKISHSLGSYGRKSMKMARRNFLTTWWTPIVEHKLDGCRFKAAQVQSWNFSSTFQA